MKSMCMSELKQGAKQGWKLQAFYTGNEEAYLVVQKEDGRQLIVNEESQPAQLKMKDLEALLRDDLGVHELLLKLKWNVSTLDMARGNNR